MAIRIQPPDIEIPEDDPFHNDLLNRKDTADVLTRIVGDIEGPCVLAIDAEWGAGKTTFLNMWAQDLRNKGFPVAKFNAWETDFAGDPLLALIDELTNALGEDGSASLQETAKELVVRTAPNLLKFIPIGGDALASIAKDGIDYFREDRLSEYQKLKEEVCEFNRALTAAAGALSGDKEDRPLVVVIDELDRCRPLYAVELLEIAKHWFMVDCIVFVLAVNRSQLAHSVRVLYGPQFDADGYLGRFFDLDFRLPAPDRQAFVKALLSATMIDEYLGHRPYGIESRDSDAADQVLRAFLSVPDFDLRTVSQSTHRLGLMLALLEDRAHSLALTAVVALILRTVDPAFYFRFIAGGISDVNATNIIFEQPGMRGLRGSTLGALIEGTIIVAAQSEHEYGRLFEEIDSPLLQTYRNADSDYYSERVLETASSMWADNRLFGRFRIAIETLELISPRLIVR